MAYWADGFRWREREQLLNTLPQFRTTVDAPGFEQFGLHFVHQPGVGPAPLPLVLSHGWPSTHYEYHDVVLRLANPGAFGDDPADAFHVVVPSLPGYGFSDIPSRRGMTPRVMATMFAAVDARARVRTVRRRGVRLGRVRDRAPRARPSRRARRHPHGHAQLPRRRLRARRRGRRRSARGRRPWRREESGYSTIQGTKPQSLAYGLTDSPAGLAGWIVEKWRRWSDCGGDVQQLFTRDELLTTDRHLLVHRHHQQRQPPLLREPARSGVAGRGRAGAAAGGFPARAGGRRPDAQHRSRRRGAGPRPSTTCSAGRSPTAASTSRPWRTPSSTSRSCGRSSVLCADPGPRRYLTSCQNGGMTTATIDLLDLDRFQRLEHHAMFERLRAENPVSWHDYPGGKGFWNVVHARGHPHREPRLRALLVGGRRRQHHGPRRPGRLRHPRA